MEIAGNIPTQYEAEEAQFKRILGIFREAKELIGPWSYLILNHGFSHRRGDLIDVDKDWNGEIDILLIAPNKIAIYELKGFTATIQHGSTNSDLWKIQRLASGGEESVGSPFIQASKQRAFVVRDFFPRFEQRHPELAHNHWIVDSRLVFRTGSDLSGFSYSVPMTETTEKLESEVFPLLTNEDDMAFVRYAFSGTEYSTGKLHRGHLTDEEQARLWNIYRDNRIKPRTAKWFKVITEEQIREDLGELGSNRFALEQKDGQLIVDDLVAEAWHYTED